MNVSDFDFELPDELIARYPLTERTASRLLCLDGMSGKTAHRHFADLPDLLQPGDLLVFNDTRVIPARLCGKKETGAQLEFRVVRVTGQNEIITHVRASTELKHAQRAINGDGTNSGRARRSEAL